MSDVAAQWESLCDELKRAGVAALDLRPDLSEGDRVEGLRFLAKALADSVNAQLGPPDHDGPLIRRVIDEFTGHAVVNTDNAYLFSEISPTATYRLTGNSLGREFIVTIASGEGPTWTFAQVSEIDGSEIECAEDGSFELIISPDDRPGNHLRLEPSGTMVLIRDYFEDWDDDPAWYHLERLDDDSAPGTGSRQEPAAVRERLARVGRQFAWTSKFWAEYPDRWRGGEPNAFQATERPDMVSQTLVDYRVGWAQLAADQALIIELDPPEGAYWVVQLYSRWGLPLDPAIAQSTLNSGQAVPDGDGRLRLVVAGQDPGVANWLDLRGHEAATIWYRLKPASAGIDLPGTRVVDLAEVSASLPDAIRVDPEQRRAQLARRRRSAARRSQR